jgi:hypothetical protein
MNRKSLPSLFAFVLAAAFAVPASAQTGVLQRCDKSMADAEQMARTITECDAVLKAETAALAAAQGTTAGPAEKVVTATSPLSVDLTRAAMTEPLHGRLVAYYAYSAFAAGDPSACAPLSHIGKPQEGLCRQLYGDLVLVRARYGSNAELAGACRRTDSESGAGADACCSLLAESRNRPDPCAAMSPKCLDAATCRAVFGSWAGDARACRSLPPLPASECKGDECRILHAAAVADCEADALFAKARKAGGAGACGASQRCRVLMGEAKAVASEIAAKDLKNPVGAWFLKSGWKTPVVIDRSREPQKAAPAPGAAPKKLEFMGFVCAEPMTSKENRTALAAALGAAHACLTDVETALSKPSRAVTEAIDEREEKIARLNVRLNKFFESGKPAKAPAPAPK